MAADYGKVYLVGAGPGDPDLLTRKAYRLLQQADVILYDRLVGDEILAVANPLAELIYIGKHQGEQERVQQRIFQLLARYARLGRTVVRLKGGDPMVFGRGSEEWLYLAARGIEVEYVPGITSAIAVPGLAGIPVTYRGVSQSFAVVTGHCAPGSEIDWAQYASIGTLVVLMGVGCRDQIAQALIAAGRPASESVAFIENGSTPAERVVAATLSEVAAGATRVGSPAVFVIGQTVGLRGAMQLLEASAAGHA